MRQIPVCLLAAFLFLSQNLASVIYAQDRQPVPIHNSQRFTLYSKNTDL